MSSPLSAAELIAPINNYLQSSYHTPEQEIQIIRIFSILSNFYFDPSHYEESIEIRKFLRKNIHKLYQFFQPETKIFVENLRITTSGLLLAVKYTFFDNWLRAAALEQKNWIKLRIEDFPKDKLIVFFSCLENNKDLPPELAKYEHCLITQKINRKLVHPNRDERYCRKTYKEIKPSPLKKITSFP